MKPRWTVRLTSSAERDFTQIVAYTAREFGARQAQTYLRTLSAALEAPSGGPAIAGVARRNDIGPGLMSMHVARLGRKGRHFVIFREQCGDDGPVIEVLRLLHDAMDLARQLPHDEN